MSPRGYGSWIPVSTGMTRPGAGRGPCPLLATSPSATGPSPLPLDSGLRRSDELGVYVHSNDEAGRLDALRLDGHDGVRVAGGRCRRRRGRQVFDHLLQ